VLVEIQGSEWRLDTFLMSCRVLGRGVEKALLGAVCQQATEAGAASIRGEFLRTAKNAQTENFYESCGFTAVEKNIDRGVWQLTLSASTNLIPRWITLHLAVAGA